MSKKNRDKKFLVFNEDSDKEPFLVRKKFQKALAKAQIIEEIPLNEQIEVIETKSNKAKLKRVCIQDLDSDAKSKVIKVWRVNLEKEYYGISTKGKTTEIALLVLQQYSPSNYRLNIILIELKESLQPQKIRKNKSTSSSLQEIEEKIRDSMNRMYMLLTLNNHENLEKGYQNSTISSDFKAAIFYNRDEMKNKDDGTESYKILNKLKTDKLITCSTILRDRDKIKINFFLKQPSDAEENRIISLKDLL